jgi:hypothetical protein
MNCFGYGNMSFDSIEEGIAYVARSIAGEHPPTAYYYAGKSLKEKLYAYNSVIPEYYDDIIGVMNRIYTQKELFKKSVEKTNA